MAGLGVVAAPAAHAAGPAPLDPSNWTVSCDTFTGGIKFGVPLVLGGTTPNTITIKGVADGCITPDDPGNCGSGTDACIFLAPAKVGGVLNSTTNDCTGLLGLSTGTTGTTNATFKNGKAPLNAYKTPKLLLGGLLPAVSALGITQTNGTQYTATWGTQYGMFQVGTSFGTSAPTVTGAFTGGDGGATTAFEATTGNSSASLGAACFTTGIKGITFGIGHLTLA